jgi:uncharacterized Zn-finger protein
MRAPSVCKFCDKAFSLNGNLTKHIQSVHLKQKPFVCATCDRAFSCSSTLNSHMRTHSLHKPYVCNMCDMAFSQSNNLVTHVRTHSLEKPYKCTTCDNAFATSTHLVIHVKRKHLDRNSIEYKQWNDKMNVAHVRKYHSDPETRAANLCRRRLHHMLKRQDNKKTARTNNLVGCSWKQLVDHLNSNKFGYFVGMEGIDIDHIRPCCSFKLANDPIEQRAMMNFNNLQLMPSSENRSKGGNFDAAEYALSTAGKAIASLRVGWEKEFKAGVVDEIESEIKVE